MDKTKWWNQGLFLKMNNQMLRLSNEEMYDSMSGQRRPDVEQILFEKMGLFGWQVYEEGESPNPCSRHIVSLRVKTPYCDFRAAGGGLLVRKLAQVTRQVKRFLEREIKIADAVTVGGWCHKY